MLNWYDRYIQGYHREVYDELLALQERVFDEPYYEEAFAVAREIMRRVRFNTELLIPRLQAIGYQFGAGFWNEVDDITPEEKASIEQDIPVFQAPTIETPQRVDMLERLVGPLPFSLKCWYEEVGSVNLIGLFPIVNGRAVGPSDGCVWDPLFIYSVDMAIKMVTADIEAGTWDHDSTLSLSPDKWFKYGFSGSGAYSMHLPCQAFDTPFLLEQHNTTFVNYLRLCFQWGGFPGVSSDSRLLHEERAYLTRDMLRF